MELPIYNVIIKEDDLGLSAVSFVDDPAIGEDFIYFNKQKKENHFYFNDEKKEVVSPILIPNQLIFRKTKLRNGEDFKYYVRWSPEIIEQAAFIYLVNQFNNNVTINHPYFTDDYDGEYNDTMIDGVYLKRMWIIDDEKEDVINTKYGYNLPSGTLCVHYKIHNDELWDMVKTGKVKGLSIEAFTTVILDDK